MVSIWGIIGAVFITKMVTRALWRRRMWSHGHGFYGGGCGGGRRSHWHRWAAMRHHFHHHPFAHDPIDLGELGDDDYDRASFARSATPPVDVAARVDEVMRGLELNGRQAAEAGDVMSIVRGAVGSLRFARSPELLLALRAAGKTPFDQDLAAAALGPKISAEAAKEALDAIEHLHNILTEEQRATLLRLTARSA